MDALKLLSFLSEQPTNRLGWSLIIKTDATEKMTKTNNPFFAKVGRKSVATREIIKITRYVNVTIGRSYEKSVENRSENETSYEVEKPKGRHYAKGAYPYISTSDKDDKQHYLSVFLNKNTVTKSVYFVDGRLATEEEIKLIKEFTPLPSIPKKQLEYGVSEDNIVKTFAPKLDNVLKVAFGKNVLFG